MRSHLDAVTRTPLRPGHKLVPESEALGRGWPLLSRAPSGLPLRRQKASTTKQSLSVVRTPQKGRDNFWSSRLSEGEYVSLLVDLILDRIESRLRGTDPQKVTGQAQASVEIWHTGQVDERAGRWTDALRLIDSQKAWPNNVIIRLD